VSEQTSRRFHARAALILVAILGIALTLRLYRLGEQCYWVDELLTMEVINGRGHQNLYLPRNVLMQHPPSLTDPKAAAPWWTIWNGLQDEGHPPLYFILARWWRDGFGISESAMRSLSVVFSLLAIVLLYAVVRELNGNTAALWSAALMTFSLPQISYAQEARNYAMLLAVALLAALFLVRIQLHGLSRWRWIALMLALLATAMTHYFSLGVLVALLVYAMIVLRRRERWLVLLSFVSAGFVFLAIWGKNLAIQWPVMQHTFPMYADPNGHATATWLRIISLPYRQLIGVAISDQIELFAGIGLAIALFLTILYRRRDLLLWWLWLVGAIAIVAILDFLHTAEQLTMVKYTILAGPAACAIAAAWLPQKFPGFRHVLPAALVILEITFLPQKYHDWKGDWADFAKSTVDITHPGEPVVIAGNGSGRPTLSWLYLGMNLYINPWPRPLAISDRQPSPELMQQLKQYPHITLVTDCKVPPDQIIPGYTPLGEASFENVGIIWSLKRK
jgi:uncharacterized membrane protein